MPVLAVAVTRSVGSKRRWSPSRSKCRLTISSWRGPTTGEASAWRPRDEPGRRVALSRQASRQTPVLGAHNTPERSRDEARLNSSARFSPFAVSVRRQSQNLEERYVRAPGRRRGCATMRASHMHQISSSLSRQRLSRAVGLVLSWRRWKTQRVLSVCCGLGARRDRIGILQPSCY
jgi:hypothetical protein